MSAVNGGCTGSGPVPGGLGVPAQRTAWQKATGTPQRILDGKPVEVASNRQARPNGIWRPKTVDEAGGETRTIVYESAMPYSPR
ncbi:MAG: hypothetical protein H7338_00370 [Candidatus Sericytochromatia bacterium]|nr:hypothetical protein [Candidatus Sericytochromatia bacterium]